MADQEPTLTEEQLEQIEQSWEVVEVAIRQALETVVETMRQLMPVMTQLSAVVMARLDSEPECELVDVAEESQPFCSTHQEFGCRVAKLREIFQSLPRPAPGVG